MNRFSAPDTARLNSASPDGAPPDSASPDGAPTDTAPAAPDLRVEEAIRANAADLLAYLTRRIDRSDAADALGAVFAVAWRRRADLPRDPTAARMWLFGVARRTLANHRRSGVRASRLTDRLRVALTSTPEPSVPGSDAHERAREVREAIARLPVRQREMVRLVHWDGFSLTEAAEIAGLRASTARTHYARARQTLARQLGTAAG